MKRGRMEQETPFGESVIEGGARLGRNARSSINAVEL